MPPDSISEFDEYQDDEEVIEELDELDASGIPEIPEVSMPPTAEISSSQIGIQHRTIDPRVLIKQDLGLDGTTANDSRITTEDQVFLNLWLKYMVEYRSSGRITYDRYRRAVNFFRKWLYRNVPGVGLKTVLKEYIVSYKRQLETEGYAKNSIFLYLIPVRLFYGWMESESHIVDSPFPRSLMIKSAPPHPRLVPTPEEIFKIRRLGGVKVEAAFAFEILLSTGLRVSELTQLRANEINLNDRPYDLELQGPSPYYCGSISIHTTRNFVKTQSATRKVFISVIAMRMLKMHYSKMGIKPDSNIPILPYASCRIWELITKLGAQIINRTSNPSLPPLARVTRVGRYDDIDPKEIPPALRKAIMRAKKSEDNDLAALPVDLITRTAVTTLGKSTLTSHSLRHACTCFNWYRNWYGERKNLVRLPRIMGHSSAVTTYQHYLLSLDLLHDDATWKRLVMGRPNDWMTVN